ncbi:MAG TPA: PhnD/SsuA/transferrin family substrate-binding protein [Gammaproteobacteria bacterium]|nr:PhnD/SsuA/transferrin family substrate-binding protein [Chromatiaceae bacterium]MCW5587750.1 PhnD/SsuA/transferrin family substrate-binding protein [Chromatiales bacterium]HOP16843.1 PhnD/SsuA/transferrin family substrate-binding protein [Gammaproteobacteria bacterium]HPQ26199.1 PhnD/SsuA/transferrin family substrate-binding protein [Gammaproteobacteria bacterium]
MSAFRRTLTFLILLLGNAAATAAETADTLHVGIFPRRPAADTQRMFQPLADHLSASLNVPVTLDTPPDYESFWAAIEQGRYDLVHLNHYHYVRAHREFGYEVVAKNEEFGRSVLRANILARSDSPFQDLNDLRGRKILFGGGRSAFISYVLATDMLRDAGLHEGDYIEQFAQNPMKAVIALHYMQSDAAAAGDSVASLPLVRQSLDDRELRVLAQSIAVPHIPWAIKAGIEPVRRSALRETLLGLNHTAKGRKVLDAMQLSGISPALDGEYDVVRTIVARVLGEHY